MAWWHVVAQTVLMRLIDRAGKKAKPSDAEITGGAEPPREAEMSVTTITLERFAYSPVGVFGLLTLDDGWSCYTVERPWEGNRPSVSCIPEGTYPLRKRESPIVHRTSGGQFGYGWEVCEVPGRSLIMLHPGNTMEDVEGCISPGKNLGYVSGVWAVTNSRNTFEDLMHRLTMEEYKIRITSREIS